MVSKNYSLAIGKHLIGRNGLLKTLENTLHAQNLLLTGPRRIGKTSLLLTLCERKRDDYIFLYASARDKGRSDKQIELFSELDQHPLAREFRDAMIHRHAPMLIDIVQVVAHDAEASSRKFVLIFDDFDVINEK